MENKIQRRRRSFFLEADELAKDNRIVVVVDNSGDADSVIYGQATCDEIDRYQGTGVAAERQAELSASELWGSCVDDYDRYRKMTHLEEQLDYVDEAICRFQKKIDEEELRLNGMRCELKELFRRYGSYPHAQVMEGQALKVRLERMKEALTEWIQRRKDIEKGLHDLDVGTNEDVKAALTEDDNYNVIHFNLCYRAWATFIAGLPRRMAKLNNHGLVKLLEEVRAKRNRREMTFMHFVLVTGTLNGELFRRTGGANFKARRNRMAALWTKCDLAKRENPLAPAPDKEELFDPSETQHGEYKLTENELIEAIDCRTEAQRLATRFTIPVDVALEGLIEA